MASSQNVAEVAAVVIRPADAGDLEAIEALLTSSKLPLAGVKESLDGFLVAEADRRIVGVIGVEFCGNSGLLRSTAVAPEWRGQGVARHLVERVIADAETRGFSSMYLLTTTAELYFTGYGFQVVDRETVPDEVRATVEFQGACPASATVMHLSIPQRD